MARFRFPFLALGLAVLLTGAGCSNLPTQPVSSISGPISEESGVSTSSGSSSEVLGLNTLVSTTTTATSTKTIGLLGGTVRAGNFTVVIPPGAIVGTATVTVSQPDLAHPIVNLGIAPASANKFLLPVLLIADAKRMEPSLLAVATISYYNPATGRWEAVAGSSVSLLNLTVTAPLWHFSTYRVESGGKAGW